MAESEVLLPRTSDAMTEAVLSTWLVPSGTEVSEGEVIAEVETDKAMVEVTATASGLLVHSVQAGRTVAIGDSLGRVLTGSEAAEYANEDPDLTRADVAEGQLTKDNKSPGTPQPVAAPLSTTPLPEPPAVPATRPTFASPLARRMARDSGMSIKALFPGSGPQGRVVRADVEAAFERAAQPVVEPRRHDIEIESTVRQRVLVENMTRSKSEVPHFYLFRDVDVTRLRELRDEMGVAGIPAPSLTAFVVKALGIALSELDFARRIWTAAGTVQTSHVGVGVAVADGDFDLVVPVITDPDSKPLQQVARELVRLSETARSRRLRPENLEGANMTVSNLGMFGVDSLLPIIPPDQAAILGVGRSRPACAQCPPDDVEVRMTLSLAADHRVMSGVGGGRVLARLADLIEHPVSIALADEQQSQRTRQKEDE